MQTSLRLIKTSMLVCFALIFTVIAYNNVIDYQANWQFVQHVLSMDDTFQSPALMSRAIHNPTIQKYAYHFIIAWEWITALFLGLACFVMLISLKSQRFIQAKALALFALFLGFLLYMLGFMVIAGEWFAMWQSGQWNGQKSAAIFLNLILFMMLFLSMSD